MRALHAAATIALGSFAVSGATPLRVLRVTPSQSASATTVVSVTFDRPVAGSLDATVDPKRIFTMVPAVPGRLEWRDPITLRFTPAAPLAPATEYTVTIGNDFAAMDGSRLEGPYRFTFRVHGAVPLTGAPTALNEHAQYLKPDAQFEVVWSTPVDLGDVGKRVYLELDRDCPSSAPVIRLKAVSQRPINDQDSWRYREAGGWERDRNADALRRVVRLTPAEPLPYGCSGVLVVPSELDAEGTSVYQRWRFTTYGPFQLIMATCGYNQVCPTGNARVQFSTPVRGADLLRGVHFLPRIPFTIQDTSDESSLWTLEASLKPRTGYAVVVDTLVLRDVFGQKLSGNPVKVFVTSGYDPAVNYDYGMMLVERNGYRTFPVHHVNVDTLLVSTVAVPESLEAFALRAPPWGLAEVWTRLQQDATPRSVRVESRRDVPLVSVVRAPVYDAGAAGSPALTAVRITYPGAPVDQYRRPPVALLQTTDLGVTARVGEEEAAVWVTGVEDGLPRTGVDVELRDPAGRVRARGVTNPQGLVRLSGLRPDSDDDQERRRGFAGYVSARSGLDRAVVPINAWSGDLSPWQFNVGSAYGNDRLPVAAAVFTERGIYRPGEPVYVKAIVRSGPLGALRVPAPTDSLRWLFSDREGGVMRDSIVRLSSFGTAAQTLMLGRELPLGTYTVSLQVKRGDWQEVANTSYRVAEYRPPEFLVTVTGDSAPRFSGDSLRGTVEARYLFGAPMARASVSWMLNLTPASTYELNIPGLDRYYLGENGWWWEDWSYTRPQPRPAATGVDTLDAAGHLTLRVPLTAADGRPANARLQATVTDVNRQTVSGSASVIVHPASFYVAARPLGSNYFWTSGTPQQIAVLAVRPDGRHVTGIPIRGTIVRREWHRVQRARDGVEEQIGEWVADTVGRCSLVSAQEPVNCAFTPSAGGTYIVSFRANDEAGRAASTSFYRWATGKDWVPWNDENQFKMDLIPDKTRYAVGDTATILVAAPFTDAEAWLTVEREGLIEQRRVRVTGGATSLKFRVTEAYAPNVFVSMVLVRGRSASPGSIADAGRPTLRVGYTELRVTPEVKRLAVDVRPMAAEYRPGDSARLRINVKDAGGEGRGRRSEVTLWAVDEGVLSLTGYKTPDPLDLLYQPRGVSLRLASNLVAVAPQVIEQEGTSIKGEQEPGGGGGLAGGDLLRSRFTATAFFLGSVETDSSGSALATAKLPDNLTTFRVMAVAVTAGDRYGHGESPLLVTRPLLARPALPRFLRMGDAFTAGVVVNQRAGGTPTVTVRTDARGVVRSGDASRTVTLAPGRGSEVRFAFRDTTADSTAFRFDVAAQRDSDAVLVKLPGRPVFTPRAFTATGSAVDSTSVVIALPEPVDPERSQLVFGIGATPLAVLAGSYRWLAVYPFDCSEQVSDELISIAALYRAGPAAALPGLTPARARAEIMEGVAVLSARQRPDGGIGLWSADDWTTPWLSAYAGEALLAARDAGIPVRDSVIKRLGDYLFRNAHERRPIQAPIVAWYSDNRVILAEQVASADFLSRAGRPDLPTENELFRLGAQLSWEDRLRLAQMMARRGARSAARQLITPIWSSVQVEGRRAVLPDTARRNWFYFPSFQRPVARLLTATLAVDSSNALIGPLVETLVEQSRGAQWGYWNTHDYGVAAAALAEFTARQTQALRGGSYEIRAGNRVLFRAPGDSLREMTSPLTGLLSNDPGGGGGQRMTLTVRATDPSDAAARGATLFFYVTVHEVPRQRPVTPDQQGIQVERWYEDYDTGKPVVSVPEGSLVRVRLRITVPAERRFVALTDPLPAGLEAVDLSLRTTGQLPGPGAATPERRGEEEGEGDEELGGYAYDWYYGSWDGGWWSPFDHKEMRDDRVAYFATVLWTGRYTATYVARATTPGTFIRPPAHAEEMYNPAVQGRSDGGTFTVTARAP